DRRFNGNSQLPICLYGELGFTSASGLNEKYECSQANAASLFAIAFDAFQNEISLTSKLSADRTISVSKIPSNWLSIVPVTLLCLATLAAVVIQQNILPAYLVVRPSPTTSAINANSFSPPTNQANKVAPVKNLASSNVPLKKLAPSDVPLKNLASSDAPLKNLAPNDSPAKNPTPNDKPALQPKSQRVQQRLIDLGYLKGQADGVWGPRSSAALAQFRAS